LVPRERERERERKRERERERKREVRWRRVKGSCQTISLHLLTFCGKVSGTSIPRDEAKDLIDQVVASVAVAGSTTVKPPRAAGGEGGASTAATAGAGGE